MSHVKRPQGYNPDSRIQSYNTPRAVWLAVLPKRCASLEPHLVVRQIGGDPFIWVRAQRLNGRRTKGVVPGTASQAGECAVPTEHA